MNTGRICSCFVALAMASFSIVELADAASRRAFTPRTSFRIGTQDVGGSVRGGGIVQCDVANILISENIDFGTITPGNSVSCFGGGGTPEHRYGRSHDLSLGTTAGLPLEIHCIHFSLYIFGEQVQN